MPKASKLRFVPSVEFRHTSGNTYLFRTPLYNIYIIFFYSIFHFLKHKVDKSALTYEIINGFMLGLSNSNVNNIDERERKASNIVKFVI